MSAIADKPKDRDEQLREKVPKGISRHTADAEAFSGDNECTGLLKRDGGSEGDDVDRQRDQRGHTGCGTVGSAE